MGVNFTPEEEEALQKLSESEEENIKKRKLGKNFPIKPPQFAHELSKFGK